MYFLGFLYCFGFDVDLGLGVLLRRKKRNSQKEVLKISLRAKLPFLYYLSNIIDHLLYARYLIFYNFVKFLFLLPFYRGGNEG
jgi:hypothetical protein